MGILNILKIVKKTNFTDKELKQIEKYIREEYEDCNVETYLKVYIPRYKKKCEVPNIIIDEEGISITVWYGDLVTDEEYKNLRKEDKLKIIKEILKEFN